jgi:2-dehydropantoate 2-reductase
MRVAIVGPGSLGTLFGGLLARAGHEVWMLHYDEAVARTIERNGVRIESDLLADAPIETDVRATADAETVGRVDLVLVLVKAHQTREALTQHGDCIGPDTTVLSLQNGLLNDRILAELVGAERTLTGVTYQGGSRGDPGEVEHTYTGWTRFGGADADAAEAIAAALREAGVEDVAAVSDYREYVWRKQIGDVGVKPLAALTRLTCGGLVDDAETVALMRQLVAEAERVAVARGVDVDVDVEADVIEPLVGSPHRSSMLQDVLAERKTEIDHVNGAVVSMADEEGVDVPANELATTLVRGLERSYLDGGGAGDE